MPYRSPLIRRPTQKAPSTRNNEEITPMDWRGLDLINPYEAMQDNRSPFARNFRMYAEEVDQRRVSISNRKGSGFYTDAVGETQNVINDSVTGASDRLVGINTEWKAAPFTPNATGRLAKLDLRMKQYADSSGAVIVSIHEDNSGAPGAKIAESGLENAEVPESVAWTSLRFIEAPLLESGITYWIVLYVQDDGENFYSWRSNSTATDAKTSDNGGLTWTATSYSLNWKLYLATDDNVMGMTRFAPSTSDNKTVFAQGTSMYVVNDVTGALSTIATGLSGSATEYYFTTADNKVFWVNGYDDLKTWDGTTVETITHAQLPKLRLAVFHKNVLWGIPTNDPNQLVFSVPPIEDDGSGNTWYEGWLSTNIGYVPTPKAGDPITAIVPFQDSLIVFTRKTKWQIFGSTNADISPREATGKKGALNQNAVFADDNYVYFVADDGIYRWNGAEDQLISELVQPEFDRITNYDGVFVTKWKRYIRVYYTPSGSAYNSRCLLYHTNLEEWALDTDAFVSHAVPWTDADDDGQLVEVSSYMGAAYFAERYDHNLGKKIDFRYHCKPESMKNPAKKKRIVKYFPLLEAEGGDYPVEIAMDKDLENNAVYTSLLLETEGAKVGEGHLVGDGTKVGTSARFDPRRMRISGYARYWQTRIKRNAINNPVNFMGYVLSYREKRL